MRRQRLGRTELKVSPIVYGAVINTGESIDNTKAYVSEAIDRGVNYFDVAPSYGDAQELLGPAIEPYRNEIVLACKTTERSCQGAQAELLESLNALHTDYFDIYQIHSLSSMEDVDAIFAPNGAMEAFVRAKRDGLIRNIGMSVHNEEAALRALELYDFDTIMFPLNWSLGINSGWGDRIAKKVQETDKGFIAIKSISHRTWREGEEKRYPKSWCRPFSTDGDDVPYALAGMKYALSKGAHTLVPPGDIEHFRFMLDLIDKALDEPFSGEDLELLRAEAEKVKDEMIFNPYDYA